MASLKKVREYFEAAEMLKQYTALTENVCAQMSAYFAGRSDDDGLMATELRKRLGVIIGEKMLAFAEEMFVELFSDEELDELIVIHSSPVFKRLRVLAPEMTKKLTISILGESGYIEKEAERIAEEVEREFEVKKA